MKTLTSYFTPCPSAYSIFACITLPILCSQAALACRLPIAFACLASLCRCHPRTSQARTNSLLPEVFKFSALFPHLRSTGLASRTSPYLRAKRDVALTTTITITTIMAGLLSRRQLIPCAVSCAISRSPSASWSSAIEAGPPVRPRASASVASDETLREGVTASVTASTTVTDVIDVTGNANVNANESERESERESGVAIVTADVTVTPSATNVTDRGRNTSLLVCKFILQSL